MKILKTELTLHASGTLPLTPLSHLANKLKAEFHFAPANLNLAYVQLVTTFTFGNEICSNFPLSLVDLHAVGMGIDNYARYVKEQLIRQTSEFIGDQIKDQLDPPEPFVDTGGYFRGQPIFLKTTGSREKDRVNAERFKRWYGQKLSGQVGT